jgi:hypothetical protein
MAVMAVTSVTMGREAGRNLVMRIPARVVRLAGA